MVEQVAPNTSSSHEEQMEEKSLFLGVSFSSVGLCVLCFFDIDGKNYKKKCHTYLIELEELSVEFLRAHEGKDVYTALRVQASFTS